MFLGGPNLYQATTYLLLPYFNVLLEGQTCIKQPPIFYDSISMFLGGPNLYQAATYLL
jgi:hypothetical protein